MHLDPITIALAQKQLDHISQHMGWAVMRTGCSPAFTESHDFSCFLADASGAVVSQADGIPIHTGGCGAAVRAVLRDFAGGLRDGDAFVLSDPYAAGGNHLPDWTVVRPVYVEGQLVGFACCRGHQTDIGGGAAGTYNSEAREIFHEGIRLPCLRLMERGELKRDLWSLLMLNTRCPDIVAGDLNAMLGATLLGARSLQSFVERHGKSRASAVMRDLLDYGERMMRLAIRRLPSGSYRARESSQTDCFEEREVSVLVDVTVRDDHLVVDFTGSSSQVPGFKNSSLANTRSAVAVAVMTFFESEIPRNEGAQRALTIIAPEGTIVNARAPAAVTMCTIFPAHDIICACWKALGQAHPAGSLAGWGRINHCVSTHALTDGSKIVIGHMNAHPGSGATKARDGFNTIGQLPTLGGLVLPNIEALEQKAPVTVVRHEFRKDGGGPGRYRGGTGMEYEVVVDSEAEYAFRSEGDGRPSGFGVDGGSPGAGGEVSVTSADGAMIAVARYCVRRLGQARISIRSPGGGGCGSPFERDPEAVLRDVRDGVVSADAARDVYGVAVDEASLTVDADRTRMLRARRPTAIQQS